MKAIVFATDDLDTGYRMNGNSSSFFILQGKPILLFVLVALDQLEEIDEIVVVGAPSKIMRVLEMALFEVPFSKKVTVCPQKEGFSENLQSATNGNLQQESDPLQVLSKDEAVLCLPGNIPLVTTAEIESFLAASDMESYDYCIGITEESVLRAFYPEGAKAGIKKPYIQVKERFFRLNNLHLIRPLKMNRIAQEFLKNPTKENGISSVESDLLPAYMASFFGGLMRRADQAQKQVLSLSRPDSSIEVLEKSLSDITQLKLKFVGRWKGAAALNIDDAACYQSISERIDDWRTLLADLNQTEEGKKQCPTSGLACKSE